jgi:hypothetical protein
MQAMRLRVVMLAMTVLLLLAVVPDACGQNVIANSQFDANIGGWASYPAITGGGATRLADDGTPTSGCLSLLNPGACDCSAFTTYCASVTPGTPYLFRYFIKHPAGQHMYWTTWTSVNWFANSGCTGNVGTPFFENIPNDLATDVWTERDLGSAVSPANAYSALVTFYIENTGGSGISFLYDDVELINDRLFESDFDS